MSRIQSIVIVLLVAFAPGISLAAGLLADKTGMPATPEAWLAQMLDARRNGAAFKDPAAFAEWLDAVTEPRFMTALATVAADPATYPKVLSDAIDPAAARNWSEFTDPQLYLRWMLASASPAFQQAIISRMTDPAKMKHWLDAMNRPEAYAPMLAGLGKAPPATAMAWFAAMASRVGQPGGDQAWLKLPADSAPASTAVRYRY